MKKCNLIIVSLLLYGFGTFAQPYDFAVKPGDKEWRSFTTSKQKYDACQVPKSTLNAMSTKDLALTCLKYPLIGTMYAHNDLQAGFNALLRKFNGFEILINRKDAGEVLLSMYKAMSVSSLDLDSDPVAQGRFTFEFTYIEITLGQRTVLANLNEGKRKELIREALRKYDDKLRLQSLFGSHGTSISAWVMGRSLNQELIIPDNSANNISNSELAKYAFLEQAVVADMRVVEGIVKQAREFVK